jgi:oligo-alginate lyase
MKQFIKISCIAATVVMLTAANVFSQKGKHPSIMLTKDNVPAIQKGIEQYPLLKKSFADVKQMADKALSLPIDVPIPADGGGGVTHEQHKRNYQYILASATVYQLTKDKKYADFVKNILLNYASQYEQWPLHPKRKENHPAGKIFWQNLNDCVWQVYVSQGYDLVYDYLSLQDRKIIEEKLFAPIVKLISEDNYATFNKIHNHGTWAVAAVGMTGYVTGNKDWSDRALRGSDKDNKTGYLAQVAQLFSPDGYYTEGPYYQRYALLPFIVFAKAINNYQPELNIYQYRNSVLTKAIQTCLQLTYTNGAFFPFNDALKEKTFATEELVYGVNIAYADIEPAADLLDVAKQQGRVIVSDAGLKVARDIAAGKARPFVYKSMWIKDGNKGEQGGVGIFRAGKNDDQQALVFKAAAQGMGHGHFDRLNILYYDNGREVLQDYGAARFINIETKSGGHYLTENQSWAKQTIAHNTVVVDKTSHFKGKVDVAEEAHPTLIHFNAGKDLQVVSAIETKAYDDVTMQRTVALATIKELEKPLIIDVFKLKSEKNHQYDLPFWYHGQITNTPFAIEANTTKMEPLGKHDGYQHLWHTATGTSDKGNAAVTFLNGNRFYTTTFITDNDTKVQFVALGANDPNFNLRNEKGYIVSQPSAKDHTFVTLLESHGSANPIAETTAGFTGSVSNVKLLTDTDEQSVVQFSIGAKTYTVTIHYNNKQSFISIQ